MDSAYSLHKISIKSIYLCNKYGLLTKCEVKMAGYWPSSFLRVYGPRRCRSSLTHKKKKRGQYPAILTEKNWSIKGFIIWLSGKFFLRDTAGSPERARWLHLARSGSQSHRAIWFILPARGAGHIIIAFTEKKMCLPHKWSVMWECYLCA